MDKNTKYIELTFDDLNRNVGEILNNSIPVWRKNKSGKYVIIPLDRLEQFVGGDHLEDIVFYIEEKWESRIKKSIPGPGKQSESKKRLFLKNDDYSDPYSAKRHDVSAMTSAEREHEYEYILDILDDVEKEPGDLSSESVTDMVDAISGAYVLSKTSFEDILDEEKEADPAHVKKIARGTTRLVQSVLGILKNKQATSDFIIMLGEKSTGSTIDHMNSVFLLFSSFCYFYNSYFKEGKIAKIRSAYKKKYIYFYEKLIPDAAPQSLEDVFKSGMRELDEDTLLQLCIGAFLHDIGKIDNIDYFESDKKFDRKIIMRHAPISYNMIVKTREFESEVAMLAALHHEYYNDSSGYGLTKILFPEKHKKILKPKYCMSYNLVDVRNGLALAYVPAKMLEIVDVFDALTDKKRKYREKEFSPQDALILMEEEFIEKKCKIDPILFAIFRDFVNSHSFFENSLMQGRS